MKALSTLLGLGLGLASALTAQSPLTTIFAGPNGGTVGGIVMVNMTVNVPAITINRIDVNSYSAAGTQGRVRVWQTLPGFTFFSGSEQAPANWQLIAEGDVIAAGQDLPSQVCFRTPFTLTSAMGPRGYAFEHIGIGARYTNGTGANQVYNTVELSLNAGAASGQTYSDPAGNNPFHTAPFNPRVFNGAIHYVVGTSAPVLSFSERVARGCGDSSDSWFQLNTSATTAVPNLTGRRVTMVPNGFGGYTVFTAPSGGLTPAVAPVPLTGWSTTIAGAVATDDGEVVYTFGLMGFPHPAGLATSLVVHNNGMISLASNLAYLDTLGGDDWAVTTTAMFGAAPTLGAPNTAWYSWHDMDITTAGQITVDETASRTVFTWNAVPSLGLVTNNSTFEMVFEASGNVSMAWQTIDPVPLAPLGYNGNCWLVGYSPGGTSVRSEVQLDVAGATLVDSVATASVTPSLKLTADMVAPNTRPVFGSTINYNVGTFPLYQNGTPYTFAYGLLYFSVANPSAPGFPLNLIGFGRPGCLLNFDLPNAIGPFDVFAPGLALAINTNVVVPSMLGLDFWAQAAVVDVFGDIFGSLVTSNALHQRVEAN